MVKAELKYNPYLVTTEIKINGKEIDDKVSPLAYVNNKRLQEWIEPKGSWKGIFKVLQESTGDSQIHIDFIGTFGDFDDLVYAKEHFGNCFSQIELVHKNKDTAESANPYEKMKKLKKLYQELQDSSIEEFITEDIQKNFENAINSDFRIVIVAPMSSGKSTLINAFIGRNLLPAFNQATTAVITEIKDNDQMPNFLVNASDKYGNRIIRNEQATKTNILELNNEKDPNDPKGKKALIHLIQLEGRIPKLPSNMLHTVFVDTPGGNYSQNTEHEMMMDEAINDENKSLILYVFNGAQLGTDDSNVILKKIANAMQNGTNGKQSRDRFLFVANRMDEFDLEKEPYEGVIKNTILKQLADNGITEPNLFLTSAQTAKLIRMVENGEQLSEAEEEDLEKLVKRFNRSNRVLTKYASISSSSKEELIAEAEKNAERAKETESKKEAEELKNKAAELNSGIPALEVAIKEYLVKYAICIKIKTVHDTFMKKVIERKMIDTCETEWAKSRESFEKIKQELSEKQEKYDNSKRKQEFIERVKAIEFIPKNINEAKMKIDRKMVRLIDDAKDKVKLEEAEYILTLFRHDLEDIGEEAQIALDNALNNDVRKACQDILDEYAEYIKELDSEGFFNFGDFDVKKTLNFSAFETGKVDDILHEDKYVKSEAVKVGIKRVEKRGFFSAIARIFGGGYETVDKYEDQQFVMLKQLILDQVAKVQSAFVKEINNAQEDTKEKVIKLKEVTISKLDGLDEMVVDLTKEIGNMLISREELEKKVAKNEKNAKWIKEFVDKIDNLLTV